MDLIKLGQAIKKRREEVGLGITQAAVLVGMTDITLLSIESGHQKRYKSISIKAAEQLLELLNDNKQMLVAAKERGIELFLNSSGKTVEETVKIIKKRLNEVFRKKATIQVTHKKVDGDISLCIQIDYLDECYLIDWPIIRFINAQTFESEIKRLIRNYLAWWGGRENKKLLEEME